MKDKELAGALMATIETSWQELETARRKLRDYLGSEFERLEQENERLKSIVEELGDIISGFVDEMRFYEYVVSYFDCEPFLKSDVDEFEKRFGGIDHVTLDGSNWSVIYTLDGIENDLYFDITKFDIDDLPEAIAKVIVNKIESGSTDSKS